MTDENTGHTYQEEVFTGQERIEVKSEQMYLGDVVSADGIHNKNKSVGIINQIIYILQSTCFGHFFKVALVFRSS